MRKLYTLILFSFISTSIFSQITLEEFGPSFDKPVSIKNAGDSRLFIVEQEGYIRILNADGTSPSTPFLDITSKVNTSGSYEKGLLGLVFHPNYASNGYFYVHYSGDDTLTEIPGGIDTPGADGQADTYVVRYTVSANPDIADPSSELVIMSISHPYDAHYGGDMAFGLDGYLYIAKGDGGNSAGDPDNRAQNLSEPNGKIFRIDVDSPTTTNTYGNNYSIPPTNPYVSSPDGANDPRKEIWSYGLRNPAKFSFDSSGNMWIADVGQDSYEEVNLDLGNTGNKNFGWSCYEGSATFNSFPGCSSLSYTSAAYEYPRIGVCAIIGGYRYQGTTQTDLIGTYFFADWCSNEIFLLTDAGGGSWNRTTYTPSITVQRWTGFGEGHDKELYIVGNRGGFSKVHKIKQSIPLSNNKVDVNQKFSIYPNPSKNGKVTLNFSKDVSIKNINTYNLQGQLIKSNLHKLNNKTIQLEYNRLSSGIYIVEAVSTSGEKSINKLIIK
ncbi:PQQ-dependent sugar dehydrogenase [Pontimicrobium aquaticum]|uniref:T9SS type A sorting domain-containing protein n=1 Tax=Pontimicrobium aquaticum TaxID=2565367 RepID=A0A4U0F0D1_9FLAO|nr:PQQ-dependent sugar dehydrogenase [Pontimicrobium aquaticum]TJY36102.1 T9SS type A sorting domain-containing protein [Pontimicrobium aquaticum]